MGRLQDLYIKNVINYLDKKGKELVDKAARTADTEERTGNQGDAFGYGIYYQKKLVKMGFWTPTPAATKTHADTKGGRSYGRQWIIEWFRDKFIPETDGFCLVVANAAFYSYYHENMKGNIKKRYRIVSQIFSDMTSLQKDIKGAAITALNFTP